MHVPPPPLPPADFIRSYLKQLREETGRRMIEKCYGADDAQPSKWWTSFSKRRFMNKSLDPRAA